MNAPATATESLVASVITQLRESADRVIPTSGEEELESLIERFEAEVAGGDLEQARLGSGDTAEWTDDRPYAEYWG